MAEIKIYGTLVAYTTEGKIAYTRQCYDEELKLFQSEINKKKADLVNGKVPVSQLPDTLAIPIEKVTTLPATGKSGTIYLLPKQDTTKDLYLEYIWVDSKWELIGETGVDLSQYYTSVQTQQYVKGYALSYSEAQTLSAAQKLQARQNAGVQEFSSTLSAGTITLGSGIYNALVSGYLLSGLVLVASGNAAFGSALAGNTGLSSSSGFGTAMAINTGLVTGLLNNASFTSGMGGSSILANALHNNSGFVSGFSTNTGIGTKLSTNAGLVSGLASNTIFTSGLFATQNFINALNAKAVRYDASQSLTDAQKNQAKTNIGLTYAQTTGTGTAIAMSQDASTKAITAAVSNVLRTSDVVNTLTSTATNKPLSAAQGKALADSLAAKNVKLYVINYGNKTQDDWNKTQQVINEIITEYVPGVIVPVLYSDGGAGFQMIGYVSAVTQSNVMIVLGLGGTGNYISTKSVVVFPVSAAMAWPTLDYIRPVDKNSIEIGDTVTNTTAKIPSSHSVVSYAATPYRFSKPTTAAQYTQIVAALSDDKKVCWYDEGLVIWKSVAGTEIDFTCTDGVYIQSVNAQDFSSWTQVNDKILISANIQDNLTSTAKDAPLSANQGKILNEKITAVSGVANAALKSSDIVTGTINGAISVKGTNVPVKGLSSAAYTASTAYATAAQGAKADTALQPSNCVDNLESNSKVLPLSANQGLVISQLVQGLNESKVDVSAIVDNLTSTLATAPLSANQGRILKGLVDAIKGFSIVKVTTLPTTGVAGTLYLVPAKTSATGNVYEEYLWIDSKYELIGSTEADLSQYFRVVPMKIATGNTLEFDGITFADALAILSDNTIASAVQINVTSSSFKACRRIACHTVTADTILVKVGLANDTVTGVYNYNWKINSTGIKVEAVQTITTATPALAFRHVNNVPTTAYLNGTTISSLGIHPAVSVLVESSTGYPTQTVIAEYYTSNSVKFKVRNSLGRTEEILFTGTSQFVGAGTVVKTVVPQTWKFEWDLYDTVKIADNTLEEFYEGFDAVIDRVEVYANIDSQITCIAATMRANYGNKLFSWEFNTERYEVSVSKSNQGVYSLSFTQNINEAISRIVRFSATSATNQTLRLENASVAQVKEMITATMQVAYEVYGWSLADSKKGLIGYATVSDDFTTLELVRGDPTNNRVIMQVFSIDSTDGTCTLTKTSVLSSGTTDAGMIIPVTADSSGNFHVSSSFKNLTYASVSAAKYQPKVILTSSWSVYPNQLCDSQVVADGLYFEVRSNRGTLIKAKATWSTAETVKLETSRIKRSWFLNDQIVYSSSGEILKNISTFQELAQAGDPVSWKSSSGPMVVGPWDNSEAQAVVKDGFGFTLEKVRIASDKFVYQSTVIPRGCLIRVIMDEVYTVLSVTSTPSVANVAELLPLAEGLLNIYLYVIRQQSDGKAVSTSLVVPFMMDIKYNAIKFLWQSPVGVEQMKIVTVSGDMAVSVDNWNAGWIGQSVSGIS